MKHIDYGIYVPKTDPGSDFIYRSWWRFSQNEVVGQKGQYAPLIVLGIPNVILESNKKLLMKFKLTLISPGRFHTESKPIEILLTR